LTQDKPFSNAKACFRARKRGVLAVIIIVAIFGLLLGSFLNVCISRIPNDESIITPPSSCPKCKARIKYYDLIPIISYILLGGRCRFCKAKIPIRYPIVEALTASLLVAFFIKTGISLFFLFSAVFVSLLMMIAFIDLENLIIPDFLMIIGIMVGFLYSLLNRNITDSLIGVCFGFLFMFSLGYCAKYLLKKEALGEGDIKLVIMLGSFLGFQKMFLSIFSASIIGSFIGIMLILLKVIRKEDYIPFGPFLSLGAVVSFFF
jgi:leader peptidase (prepilin peptidase)/N-methyltransferase